MGIGEIKRYFWLCYGRCCWDEKKDVRVRFCEGEVIDFGKSDFSRVVGIRFNYRR